MESSTKLLRMVSKGIQKKRKRGSIYYSTELHYIKLFSKNFHLDVLQASQTQHVQIWTHPAPPLPRTDPPPIFQISLNDAVIHLLKPDKIILALSVQSISSTWSIHRGVQPMLFPNYLLNLSTSVFSHHHGPRWECHYVHHGAS